jgi:hypothetical protein
MENLCKLLDTKKLVQETENDNKYREKSLFDNIIYVHMEYR